MLGGQRQRERAQTTCLASFGLASNKFSINVFFLDYTYAHKWCRPSTTGSIQVANEGQRVNGYDHHRTSQTTTAITSTWTCLATTKTMAATAPPAAAALTTTSSYDDDHHTTSTTSPSQKHHHDEMRARDARWEGLVISSRKCLVLAQVLFFHLFWFTKELFLDYK
jgi:hypothetical protein